MKNKEKPATPAAKGNSTWGARPATGDWNTATNWNPAEVPTRTASFGASSQTGISFSETSGATVEIIEFSAGAPAYTLTFNAPAPKAPALTIAGEGISSHSANTQHFVIASSAICYTQPQLKFTKSASAGGTGTSYSVGPSSPAAAGGGVLGFYDTSTAGSATFTVTTGAGTPVKDKSTVGGEVSFSNSSSAGTARFTVYGSTTTTDGDTFGNTVFHDKSTAADAVFVNAGGTVSGGDGGNTQFYDDATAAHGLFHNVGGTVGKANGGDVTFEGTSTAGDGNFHNYAATANGGYGGVTSFNADPPELGANAPAASSGSGHFYNYGAKAPGAGGGHTFFNGMYGSATAEEGTFINYGSAISGDASTAGHTVFSISLPQKTKYCPTAGKGTFWNFPGTAAGAPGGYTEFTVYPPKGGSINGSNGPGAGTAKCVNHGAVITGAQGGQTIFSGTSRAEHAELNALGGSSGGGGTIVFSELSSGGEATVRLMGNGTLDISSHAQPKLTIGNLELTGGSIKTTLGTDGTCLALSGKLTIHAKPVAFNFETGKGFSAKKTYTILTASNLSKFTADQFTGNNVGTATPIFKIAGDQLQVSFSQ